MREFCQAIRLDNPLGRVTDPFDRLKSFFDATERRIASLSNDLTRAGKGQAHPPHGERQVMYFRIDQLVEEANLLRLERNTWLLLFGVYRDIHQGSEVPCTQSKRLSQICGRP